MPIEKVNTVELRRLRDQAGMSVDDAIAKAKKLGHKISRQQWYNVEDGTTKDPRLSTLNAMAAVFDRQVKDLLK